MSERYVAAMMPAIVEPQPMTSSDSPRVAYEVDSKLPQKKSNSPARTVGTAEM